MWNKTVLLLAIWDSISSFDFSQSWQYPSEVIILTLLKEQKQLTGERCCHWGSALLTQQEWGWKAAGSITGATQPPGQDKKRKTVAHNSTFPWGIKELLGMSLRKYDKNWGEMKVVEDLHSNYEEKEKLNMSLNQGIIYCLRVPGL